MYFYFKSLWLLTLYFQIEETFIKIAKMLILRKKELVESSDHVQGNKFELDSKKSRSKQKKILYIVRF